MIAVMPKLTNTRPAGLTRSTLIPAPSFWGQAHPSLASQRRRFPGRVRCTALGGREGYHHLPSGQVLLGRLRHRPKQQPRWSSHANPSSRECWHALQMAKRCWASITEARSARAGRAAGVGGSAEGCERLGDGCACRGSAGPHGRPCGQWKSLSAKRKRRATTLRNGRPRSRSRQVRQCWPDRQAAVAKKPMSATGSLTAAPPPSPWRRGRNGRSWHPTGRRPGSGCRSSPGRFRRG